MSAAEKVQQHPAFVQAQNKATHYVNQLDKELTKYPALNTFEERTQVPKAYAVLGGVVLVALLHLVNPLAAPVSNLVGWALPAYLSFRAIESPSTHDDVQWLTYWVVFGFFNFLESFAISVVLYYFPWYFAFKTVFILWLQLPAFRGAQTMYHSVLKPVVLQAGTPSHSAHTIPNNTRVIPVQPESATGSNIRERVAAGPTDL
ncbi:TB2/DP1, HVA22 family-domain-containing protein [Pterulicium gracile]|uniref:Protein YOP1 n=1 Tax=Pterulicium gracile TaxID=1884261 RepID=A0A5C3QDN7_9AGAR|nr:TB2/DP1, HVA22 family-domain-containing protein [Pterula gracilis]